MAARGTLAWVLRQLGYSDQALRSGREALRAAEELAHHLTLCFALCYFSALHRVLREPQAAQERAEAVIALSAEHAFSEWFGFGTVLRASALAQQGQTEEGIAQMRQLLDVVRASGMEIGRMGVLGMLAEAYVTTRQTEEGLAVVAEALDQANRTGIRSHESYLYRFKGELLLAHSDKNQSEAEDCLRQGIDVARRQSAKSLERQVATSLSRLWQKQGKKKEARQLPAEIYGWFTEGFDTRDLREAKALLDELG